MARYLLEDGSGFYELESGLGVYLLEGAAGADEPPPYLGGGYYWFRSLREALRPRRLVWLAVIVVMVG